MYRTLSWIAAHEARDLAALLASWFPTFPQPILTACFDGYKAIGLWNRAPILQRAGFEWLRDAALATGILKKNSATRNAWTCATRKPPSGKVRRRSS